MFLIQSNWDSYHFLFSWRWINSIAFNLLILIFCWCSHFLYFYSGKWKRFRVFPQTLLPLCEFPGEPGEKFSEGCWTKVHNDKGICYSTLTGFRIFKQSPIFLWESDCFCQTATRTWSPASGRRTRSTSPLTSGGSSPWRRSWWECC